MTAKETRIQIQKLLFPDQPKEWDGFFGPKTSAQLSKLAALPAHAEWPPKKADRVITAEGFAFSVIVEGDDLVIKNGRITCFGGTNDPQDSGETASGISTKDPSVKGCALPMNYTGPHAPTRKVLAGSPLPMMPWKTPVEFTVNGKTVTVPLIDLGPAKGTGNSGDLTVAAAKEFNSKATATNFAVMGDIRIRGGAKFL